MAEYYNERSLLQGSTVPQFDVGALTRVGGLLQQSLGSVKENEIQNAQVKNQFEQNKRAKELFDRQTAEYNRDVGIREGTKKVAQDFMTNPETYGAEAELRPLWEAAQRESERRLASGEAPFSPEESSRLQALAESRKPFKEDAQGKVAARLAEIGVANPHALAGEITAGLPSRAYMQEQADKNREVQQNYYNELTKSRIAYGKDMTDVAKANAEAENKKAENVFEALQKMYGGGSGSSGSGGSVGGKTLTDAQMAVQELDIGPMDTNSAYQLLNKGISQGLTPAQSLYAIKNSRDVSSTAGLTTSKINEDLFDANIKDIKERGIPGSGSGYKIERVGSALRPEDYAPTMIQRQIVDYNPKGFEERLAKEAPFLRIQNGEPVQAPASSTGGSIKTEMPESLQKAEGTRLEPYKDTKGNVTVSTGYNMSGKSRLELMQDFKEAGIDSNKIDGLLKMDGTKLTPVESKALDSVSYAKNGVDKLQKIGIDVDAINPKLAEIAVSQAYRGDIVKDGSGYRGRLYEYLKNDDLSGMVKDITTSKDIPNEVKTRLKLVTGIGTAGSEGPRTKAEAEYIGPNDRSSRIQELVNPSKFGPESRATLADATRESQMFNLRNSADEASKLSLQELLSREPIKMASSVNVPYRSDVLQAIEENKDRTLPQIIQNQFDNNRLNSALEQNLRQESIANKIKNNVPLSPVEQDWIERMKGTKDNLDRLRELGIIR